MRNKIGAGTFADKQSARQAALFRISQRWFFVNSKMIMLNIISIRKSDYHAEWNNPCVENITTCFASITLIGCAGCGAAVDQQDTQQPTGSADSDASKDKIANSIPDYIDFLLDLDAKPDTKYPMSDAQKTILKRSRKSGSVSKPDYELAWSNYKQCVTGYGYTTPVLRQFSNGLYMIAMRDTTGMSDQQRKKFNEDENKCYNTEVIAVTGVYQMQIGNPGMLSDGDQAMVDCLHKAGIVPKNYDKEAYKKDLDAHAKNQPTTVDFSNAEMQSCWVANGASFGDVNDTDQWKPLG